MSISIKKVSTTRGFTLLEILLVVGIIAILAGIVILAINPTKQLGDTRNAQRRSDVLTILNAIYQYSIDNLGSVPDLGSVDADCDSNSPDASSTEMYDALVGATSTYLVSIPHDPSESDQSKSGYKIATTTGNRITICAPYSVGEGNVVNEEDMIKVTR